MIPMKKPFIMLIAAGLLLPVATSCSPDDDTDDYADWRSRNDAYVVDVSTRLTSEGSPEFQTIVPSWAPGVPVYVKWHNDRTLTAENLSPLDNSTIKCNYTLTDIDGNQLDKGDGYVSRPCNNVTGFWTAVTNMNVGDSVTAIVPYSGGYGSLSYGSVKPYTTLIFAIRLQEIIGYEIKH